MKTVLHRITRDQIHRDPFPHLIIDGAVEPDIYEQLVATFPSEETLLRGRPLENNTPYRFSAEHILREASDCWREFVRVHTSAAFYREAAALFGLPDAATTSIRFLEPFADVALECQIIYGSPVTRASRSHPVHVDREVALYAGLLYFRRADDDAPGGDLELYRFRGSQRRYDAQRFVDDALVEKVKTIPYAANRLVFFPHSPDALHATSVRSVTPHPRLHVNFVAERRERAWEAA